MISSSSGKSSFTKVPLAQTTYTLFSDDAI